MNKEKKKGKMLFFRATEEMKKRIQKTIIDIPGLTMSEFIRDIVENNIKKGDV